VGVALRYRLRPDGADQLCGHGKQYIAVAAGPHWLGTKPTELKLANACSMVYVFGL
jgi:hypothetical protein